MKQVPPEQAPFLITPLAVEPQSTQAGKLGFWLNPMLGDLVSENLQSAVDDKPGAARIRIQDYVSGQSITVPVPGRYP